MNLTTWALRHHISPEALEDLRRRVMGLYPDPSLAAAARAGSEADASNRVRLAASTLGERLWRNNVGAGMIDDRMVRWGLANDSTAVNRVIKSGDLIGIRPVRITHDHLGHVIGQFVSREVKAPGWKFAATPREVAQQNWAALVLSLGGDASFTTGGYP